MKSKIFKILAIAAIFFGLSFLAITKFNVNFTAADGSVISQTFVLGEEILIRAGGSLVAATITTIGKGSFTAHFKGGGTASFSKRKAIKKPYEAPAKQKNKII